MSQSLSKIIVHIIFATKQRTSFISESVRSDLYSYIGGVLRNLNSKAIKIGGTVDHIHILCLASKNMAPCDIIEEVKKRSSKWIKTKGEELQKFQWQNGYGIFSVSQSNVPEVIQYISKQRQHHKKISFQEEFTRFLEKHQVEFSEKYVYG